MEVLTRRDDILAREVGKEYMLYDAAGKIVHVLNDTAHFIWEHCNGKHTQDDIVQQAVSTYNISREKAVIDIKDCISEFRRLSLLRK